MDSSDSWAIELVDTEVGTATFLECDMAVMNNFEPIGLGVMPPDTVKFADTGAWPEKDALLAAAPEPVVPYEIVVKNVLFFC